jgi:25S rRNA (uracil2843-N3)-methyltransferase
MVVTPPERRLLALLRLACAETLASADLQLTLQQCKQALFAKDYELAFGSSALQSVYVARWVPSRALMFRSVFSHQVLPLVSVPDALSVVALGAGSTSELIALASLAFPGQVPVRDIILLDLADWSTVVSTMETWLRKPEKDCGLGYEGSVAFKRIDCLEPDPFQAALSLPASVARWYTICFTIHELFLQSRPKTVAMLFALSEAAQPNDLLIIVESASLSTVEINGKAYQLGLLLDHVLVKSQGWKLLEAQDRCAPSPSSRVDSNQSSVCGTACRPSPRRCIPSRSRTRGSSSASSRGPLDLDNMRNSDMNLLLGSADRGRTRSCGPRAVRVRNRLEPDSNLL